MYGQFSPQQVHESLLKFNASFIILEDSQCLSAGRSPDRCALTDTVDLAYGHVSTYYPDFLVTFSEYSHFFYTPTFLQAYL